MADVKTEERTQTAGADMREDGMPEGQAPAPQRRMTAVETSRAERTQMLSHMVDAINKNRSQIEAFLKPVGGDFDFFKAAAIVGLQGTMKNDSEFFSKVSPKSFLEAVMRSAKDGLLPDGREAAIGRFGEEAAYLPMIQGYAKILFATGLTKDINHDVVIEGDDFDFQLGTDPWVRHKPSLKRDSNGEAIGAWCLVRTTDGGIFLEVVNQKDLERIAKVNKSTKGPRGDWKGEMHRKAPFRRLIKRLPRHPRLDSLITHEEMLIKHEPEADTPHAQRHQRARTISTTDIFKDSAYRGPPAEETTDAEVEAEVTETQTEGGGATDEHSQAVIDWVTKLRNTESGTDLAEAMDQMKADEEMATLTEGEADWLKETVTAQLDKFAKAAAEAEAREQAEAGIPDLQAALSSSAGVKVYEDAELWKSDVLNKMASLKAKQRAAFWKQNLDFVMRAKRRGHDAAADKILAVAQGHGLPAEAAGG